MRRYLKQKKALKATEKKAKDERRVQQAANALKKAQKKKKREAKTVTKQLMKNLQDVNAFVKHAS